MSIPGILPPAAWGDASGSVNLTLIQTLQSLGLTSGLQVCLDAGDSSSYSGSGQTWSDVSGNGNDFYRGTTSSSQSSDPTFNGAAGTGGSSNYWSVDGGDYFTLVASNPSWVSNLHKAGQTQTMAMWVYLTSVSTTQGLIGTADASSPGFVLVISSVGGLYTELENGTTSTTTGGPAITAGSWHFAAVSYTNTNGSTKTSQKDGTTSTNAMDIPFTPSASAAPLQLRVGYSGGSYSGSLNPLASGSRIASAMIWGGVGLTGTQLAAIYEATRSGFGL